MLSSYEVEISWHFKAEGKWVSRNIILLWSKGNWFYFGQDRILYKFYISVCVALVACKSGQTLQGNSFGLV